MNIKKTIICLMTAAAVCVGSIEAKAYLLIDFLLAPEPTPVVDPPSSVPLGVISAAQTTIKAYTDTESKLQNMLKNTNTSVDLGIFKIKLNLTKDTQKMAKGFLDIPDELSREYTGVSSKKLAQITQEALTTTAGTIETISRYMKERAYEEQNRSVQMVASALVIKNGLKTLQESIDAFQKGYKGGASDYNQALRDNANVRLLYDQLLSLQQQIVAQRVQIKGGTQKGFVMPLTQSLMKD